MTESFFWLDWSPVTQKVEVTVSNNLGECEAEEDNSGKENEMEEELDQLGGAKGEGGGYGGRPRALGD